MCVVPFIQPRHNSPIGTFYDEWLAFAFGLTAISILALQSTRQRTRVPALSFCMALFALVLFLRALGVEAAYAQSALIWALYALFAAAVVMLGSVLATQ